MEQEKSISLFKASVALNKHLKNNKDKKGLKLTRVFFENLKLMAEKRTSHYIISGSSEPWLERPKDRTLTSKNKKKEK